MSAAPLEPARWGPLARAAEAVRGRAAGGAVMVWGHDDLDGITSTAIVLRALGGLNLKSRYHIPPRSSARYGLDPEVVRALPGQGVGVLLTVDCGISNSAEIRTAKDLGLTTVVTDHHELPRELPRADALVNPKLPEEPGPTPELAGCGVALYLAAALELRSGSGWLEQDQESLSWAVLGTVSDRVPLVEENRAIVKMGLPALADNPVIRRVAEFAGFDLSAGLSPAILRRTLVPLLSFAESEGPRHETVELLRGDFRPQRMAEIRNLLEERGRALETQFKRLLAGLDPGPPYILAVDEALSPDMTGALASRLRDETGKPAVVATLKHGLLAGECRGMLPFDFVEFLGSMAHVFLQHGGHKQAAGFTVVQGSEAEFSRLAVREFEARREMIPRPGSETRADYRFKTLAEAAGIAEELADRAPFGPGNPMPKALVEDIRIPRDAPGEGSWALPQLMECRDSGEQAGPLSAFLDVTHSGTLMINLKTGR